MILLLSLALVAMPCSRPRHYDGDDIRCDSAAWRALSGGHGMRLGKVDAPEIRCRKTNHHRPCHSEGALASRDHLRYLTAYRPVTCRWTGERTSIRTGARPVVRWPCPLPPLFRPWRRLQTILRYKISALKPLVKDSKRSCRATTAHRHLFLDKCKYVLYMF
jgi:hypothetical protein